MHGNSPSPAVLFVYLLAFPFVLFGAFWAVGHLFAALSGWSALAARYRAVSDATGHDVAEVHSGRLGLIGYGGVLSLATSERGLHLDVAFIPGHPPLVIPWKDVEISMGSLLGRPQARIKFAGSPGVVLSLGGKGAAAIARVSIRAS